MKLSHQNSRRGLTLVELLLGIMITAMIATGVAVVLQAASYGTSSKREVRRLAVRTQQLRHRLDESARAARAVLAFGESEGAKYIVFWKGDTFGNDEDQVNLGELQMVEWSPDTREVICYEALTEPEPDTLYAPSDDFRSAILSAATSGRLIDSGWADNVSSFSLEADSADPATARLVTWRFELVDDLLTQPVVGVVALRGANPPE